MTARDPLVLGSRADTDRDRFRFHTADGVHAADAFCPGDLLALERLWERDLGRLLHVEAGYGVVGVVLAEAADAVRLQTSNARAAALAERNVAANGVDATVAPATGFAPTDQAFDAAVYVPRPYTPIAVGNQRIAATLASLSPGGELFVAAKPETGRTRYESTLDRLARVETVGTRDGWALLRATRPAEFDPPTFAEPERFEATVDGTPLTLVSAPGLFAAGGLDHGTKLLAGTATVDDGDRVLDLCCGYAPLGTYAGLRSDCELWCTDADRVATACAERTLAANGVDGTVVTADSTAGVAERTFEAVLCNPPTHAGDSVLDDLFRGTADVLADDGCVWLVHHRDLSLDRHLRAFDAVETVAAGAEHVVRRAE